MAEANVVTSIPQISFPFKISNISKLKDVWSPKVMVYDIPWQFHVVKSTDEEEQCLAVYLYCAIEDKSPNWSHVATATFKLVPLSGSKNGIEHCTKPYLFDCQSLGFGFRSFITWKQLFSTENNYIKDDTLTLEIKIVVADPNDKNPSKMLFQTIKKSCDASCLTEYRLNVTNIDKLMAAKSPEFQIQKSPWVFMICKGTSHLSVSLDNRSAAADYSCNVRISLKLISSKKEIKSIEPAAQTELLKKGEILEVNEIISWDELVKPENGFVNKNSIIIEIEMIAGLIAEEVTSNEHNVPILLKLECAICLEAISNQEVSDTPCGHLFCSECIKKSIEAHGNHAMLLSI